MNITFTSKKGRSTITSDIDVGSLRDEEELQEVLLAFFDFLIAIGADLPEEIIEELEQYDRRD